MLATKTAGVAAKKNSTVMIVDDQESMRGIIVHHLRQFGLNRFVQAGGASEALDKLRMGPVDLILCDYHMAGANGLDLLKAVRSRPVLKKIPFIMITGNQERETIQAAIKAGVNNYVVKPVAGPNLRARIEQVIGKLP